MSDQQHDSGRSKGAGPPTGVGADTSAEAVGNSSDGATGNAKPQGVTPPAPAGPKRVRSGLAQKRNPVFVTLGSFGNAAGRLFFKDLLNTFLLFAASALRHKLTRIERSTR